MSKMKKLEELGVSPAPWTKVFDEYGDEESKYQVAVSDERFPIGAVTLIGNYCEEDACLIAAAPELYECLREEFEKVCINDGKCTDCPFVSQCRVKKWRTALAKASGEGECHAS